MCVADLFWPPPGNPRVKNSFKENRCNTGIPEKDQVASHTAFPKNIPNAKCNNLKYLTKKFVWGEKLDSRIYVQIKKYLKQLMHSTLTL